MRVVLHVGLPKTGTTYLQALLAGQRESLRSGGVVYPFVRPGAMFEGAVEVRGSAAKFGLDPARVQGTWQAVCDRARTFLEQEGGSTALLSHEVLAGATPDQVRRALAPLAGLEVHVVVTARDLGRQAVAHWQEEVKLGSSVSFAELERAQLRCDSGRDAGPDEGGRRPHFWHAQDFADALRRWTDPLPEGRGHLVLAPPPGAPRELLWQRFAQACGIDPALVDPGAEVAANPSLGAEQVALLRAVNREVERLGSRGRGLDAAQRHRLVKRGYAEGVLAARPGRPARTPAGLADVLGPPARRWLEEVVARGHSVHGDPGDLDPVLAAPGEPAPDVAPPAGEDPVVLARDLVGASGARRASRPWRPWRGRGGPSGPEGPV